MSRLRALIRHYSSQTTTSIAISPEARRKWGINHMPSPRSILNDDDTPLPPSLSPFSEDEDDHSLINSRNPSTPPLHLRKPPTKPTPNEWKNHRQALHKSFPEGWSPRRKLSRESMHGLRELHKIDPQKFTTPLLAERFRVSPEAVRRILKSKWEPSGDRKQKWQANVKRDRKERAERQRQTLEKEMEETRQVLLAKRFSGGLSLKG